MPEENDPGEEVLQILYTIPKGVIWNPLNNLFAKDVVVHELSSRPTDFWKRWTKTAKVMRLQVRAGCVERGGYKGCPKKNDFDHLAILAQL